jgi:hypothetical protein
MCKEILYYFIIIQLIKNNKKFKKYTCEDCDKDFYSNKDEKNLKYICCNNSCCEKIVCPRGCFIKKDCDCGNYFNIKMNKNKHTFNCNECNNNTYTLIKWIEH